MSGGAGPVGLFFAGRESVGCFALYEVSKAR